MDALQLAPCPHISFCVLHFIVTNRYSNLISLMYEELWYLFPLDQQKYFILMILNERKPVYLEKIATQCTRETFKGVIDSSILVIWNEIDLLLFSFIG